jgi:CRP/FNR family transcriptional regulator
MNILPSSNFKQSKIYKIIKNIPFFACLSDEELTELQHIIIEKHFVKNELILMEEDTPNFMYIVFSGKVKAVKISTDGEEQILAIHKRGDFFGEMALLDGKTLPATVIAMEEVSAGLIARDTFEKYLLKNITMLRELIAVLCSRLREAWLMIKIISLADAEQRLRAILTHLSTQYGVTDMRGTLIAMRFTHKDIAGYASVSRETVTRFLRKFSKAGEIELVENKYILLKPSFAKKIVLL